MKNLLKFVWSLLILCAGNIVVAQNPTVINDSLIVNQRVYAKEKLIVEQEAKFKQDIKVLGTARLQGDLVVSGTAKFENNVKMTGIGTETVFTEATEIIVILPNGQLKKGTFGTLMTAVSIPQELDLCGANGGIAKWWAGVGKLYTGCSDVNVGIATNDPVHKLHVNSGNIFGQKLLTGNSSATTDALYNGFANNNATDLMQLGVKVGALGQTIKFRILNTGAVDMKNTGSTPSLTINNGTGHAIVVYANGGNKILQLEDDGLLRSRKIKVDTDTWADYVFKQGYYLMSLAETEEFIQKNGHLPGVPNETVLVDEGLDIAEMQRIQMEKIEEMYLHMIEMDKKITSLQEENASLKAELESKNH